MEISLSKKASFVVLAIAFAALGGLGVWYWQSSPTPSNPQTPPGSTPPLVEEKTTIPPAQDTYTVTINDDGTRTFETKKFGFRITFPNRWNYRFDNELFIDNAVTLSFLSNEESGRTGYLQTGVLVGSRWYKDVGKSLREALLSMGDISEKPNYTVSGKEAFRFSRNKPSETGEEEIVFETEKYYYSISIPLEKKNNVEYEGLIKSFELLE